MHYFQDQVHTLGLDPKDRAELIITDQYQSSLSGVTHVYVQQRHNGIDVRPGLASVHFDADGSLVHVNDHLLTDLEQQTQNLQIHLNAEEAIVGAAQLLGQPLAEQPQQLKASGEQDQAGTYSADALSKEAIPVKLVYQYDEAGALHLTWEMVIHLNAKEDDVWMYWIDAQDGSLVNRHNQTLHCHFDKHSEIAATPVTSIPTDKHTKSISKASSLEGANENMPLLSFNGQYNFFAPPVESPLYGNRSLKLGINLIDPAGSPYGWHDTDGNAATIEYGYTRGNNAYAYYDPTGLISNPPATAITRVAGIYVSGNVPMPPNLNFNYTNDIESVTATDFLEDAVTNLFVWNNIAHDVFYKYGFDEAAGNFQETNHTGEGLGTDYVLAEVQDGGGVNDARFQTPVDGQNPTMRMFLWNTDLPDSRPDGDFDNLIIIHEYGHGVTYRLIGGPSNVTCLLNFEQGGEGWSDFFGLLFTMQDMNGNTVIEEDVMGEGIRGIGNYVLAGAANDVGIRPAHYTTNMDCTTANCNDYTYDDLLSLAAPHGVGFLWCSMLWDMTWNLMDEYGFESDIYNTASDAGNIRALKIVIEALKFTPCDPTFIEMRDAILMANNSLYGGEGQGLIWDAFARRGLGFSATAGGNEAFDNPYFTITKTVDKQEAENGETVMYTITVENNSDALLTGAVISDVVSPDLNVLSISNGGSLSGNTITYPGVAIPVGATRTRTFSAVVSTASGTTTLFEEPVEGSSLTFVPAGAWLTDTGNPNPSSGSTTSWWHLDAPTITDGSLVMNLNLDDTKNNHLSFWHYYDLEFTVDGAVIEVLDGADWVDLSDRIIKNGYPSVVQAALPNPIGVPIPLNVLNGRRCFTGYSGGYINTIVDLSGYDGLTPIRFRIATNESNVTSNCDNTFIAGCDGWYLDDFELLDLVHIKNTACVGTNQGESGCDSVGRVGTDYLLRVRSSRLS